MIYQGGNSPLILIFDAGMKDIPEISVGLYHGSTELKHWDKSTVLIDGPIVSCPMTQDETAKFSSGQASLEVKVLGVNGEIILYEVVAEEVIRRNDKTIRMGVN